MKAIPSKLVFQLLPGLGGHLQRMDGAPLARNYLKRWSHARTMKAIPASWYFDIDSDRVGTSNMDGAPLCQELPQTVVPSLG